MKKKIQLDRNEVKALLNRIGVEQIPQYKHADYMFTSFSMPYPTKEKLDRICKRLNVTKSGFVRLLIDAFEE